MKLFQKGQPGHRLSFKQHEHDRKLWRVDVLIKSRVVLYLLPLPDALIGYQQNESGCVRNCLRQGRRPAASRTQVARREEDRGPLVLPLDRSLDPFSERLIGRMIAEEPAAH